MIAAVMAADPRPNYVRLPRADMPLFLDGAVAIGQASVLPIYQVTGLENVWREDEVQPGIPAEKLLEMAPEKQNNQVKVPQVL